jgi:NAD(P)H-hydrate epimerase
MDEFNVQDLKKLYIPLPASHKGQNGKVMVIAGSKLFHAAALWSLEAASHLTDMVYFASTHENNDIVLQAKNEFRSGIVVPRDKIHDYIREADSILIGPGLPRTEGQEQNDDSTREMTRTLLSRYNDKKWVIDGGSLQTMEADWIPQGAILTPHQKEFSKLFSISRSDLAVLKGPTLCEFIRKKATEHHCTIVLKGQTDIVCSPDQCVTIPGGNAGMTKGGTGDVLAGVAVGLYAKNDAFLSACAASYFNKRASENLYVTKGYWYSTSDLVDEIPRVMKKTLL